MTGTTPLYGIRYPDPTTKLVALGPELELFAGDVERVLAAAQLPVATPAPVVVAASAAARNSYWGVPGNETARRTLQNQGATTIRTDKGFSERYFATWHPLNNPGGANPPGWYQADEAARLSKTTAQKTHATGLALTVIQYSADAIGRGLYTSDSPSRITIRRPGTYVIRTNVRLDDQSEGYSILRVAVNGGAYGDTEDLTSSFAAGGAYLRASEVLQLKPGDYVESYVYCSQPSRNITTNSASLSVARIGD